MATISRINDDRSPSIVRVLVVEDYEPFRRFVCSTLGKRPEVQVIGEASDGLVAVQKAEDLQPDLIVLDLGLPTLNGIEAARRIRKLSPQSKILVLSQESSADLVHAVLSLGALGYVVKAHAGSELLAGVEAVCQNRQFVSSGLSGHDFTDATNAQVPDLVCHGEALPSLVPRKAEITPCHAVQFYSDDALFLDGFTHFITAGLKAENAVIVVATESRRASLLQRLRAGGVDVAAAIKRKRYIPLDVTDTFSPVQFAKVVGDLVVEAAKAAGGEHLRVAAG
jgi:DNA-binding NarL/FixJ family response regulator